jgi:hypothetical protein
MIPANCVFTLVGSAGISVSITNLTNGAQFSAPASIPIQTLVFDITAPNCQVSIFNGTNNIGTLSSPPYNFMWTNVPTGNYTLTATATNPGGAGVVSAPVNVSVLGPIAMIKVVPSNVTVAPFGSQPFTAVGTDALGNTLTAHPSVTWSATGGLIGSNGVFFAGTNFGGPYTITASNNSIAGAANVTITSPNLAPAGVGYTWYSLAAATANSPTAAAPGINDGNLSVDVPLLPGGAEETFQAWEAAGVVWNSPQNITAVTYVNGSYTAANDGVFAASFGLQFSPDGTTWTNAGPQWTASPAYIYNSPASGDVSFTFTGPETTVEGVRGIGLVHTATNSQNTWLAAATEVQAAGPPAPSLNASAGPGGIAVVWSSFATNFFLESATNLTAPSVWSAITNVPQTVTNYQQQVVISPASKRQFFRLQHQ